MSTKLLDGKTLRRMYIGAAETIRSNCDYINELNVFPVPDGDTGTNMMRTIEGGISDVVNLADEVTVAEVAHKFARGSLLGARGNSGVILSQIFAGIEEGLAKCECATVLDVVNAYKSGVKKSYGSVMNPTEGTILTVFREATEFASAKVTADSTIEEFLSVHIEEAKRSLARTKEILPVLKEADVVDSGGAGYLCIASGMYAALTGEKEFLAYEFEVGTVAQEPVNFDAFTRDSVLEFGYCTEFFLRLQTAKTNPESFDIKTITDYLESVGGNSIVSYKTDDIVKVHVHTNDPGLVLTKMREYGEFLTVKIENMSLQHNESEMAEAAPKKERTAVAVLTVATGDGMCELFKSMGASGIISGGQTNNPSADEFLKAFDEVNADDILVLPNNKNIFLTAKQSAELYDKSRIHIIPTASLMQGFAALSVISPELDDLDTMIESANEAAQNVIDAEITYAVRDAVVGGVEVKKDDYMAISSHEIKATAKTAEDALIKMLEGVEDIDDYAVITVFVGADVTEEVRAELTENLESKYPDHEIIVYEGGQEIYSYLVAIE